MVASVVLAAVVLVTSFALLPQLFSVANDEDYARTTGLSVRFYNVLISVLAAVTVSVAMRTVGLLLVSALMIIPVATAQQFSRGFKVTMLGAMVAGTLASLTGVTLSAFADVPPGATIVLVSLAGFALTFPLGLVVQRRRRATDARSRCRTTFEDATSTTPSTSRTATSTGPGAGTRPWSTATTSTTSTADTGTRPTEVTMTSTDPSHVRAASRPTRQRRAIAGVMEAFDDFRSAQEIHALLSERGEQVGLSTVYRALQAMADAGEIDSLRTESGESIYRRCSGTHHHHLVCRSCGATVEVEGPTVEKWTRSVAAAHGYSDVSHTLEIFGTCGSC